MSTGWRPKSCAHDRLYSRAVAEECVLLSTTESGNNVHCELSESLIVTLLSSGALKAEQLRCLDRASAMALKRIVLLSCRDGA